MKHLTFIITAGYPCKMNKEEMTAKINRMAEEIKENLAKLPGVSLINSGSVYYLGDTPQSAKEDPDQARMMFAVEKIGRGSTWRNVMDTVNKTYAPHYKFVNF